MAIRRKRIREEVQRLLEAAGVTSAPVDVRLVARVLGLQIVEAPNDDEYSGFLLTDAATGQCTIGVNSGHHKHRKRFTIAHEIGHHLLHDGGALHIDSNQSFRIAWRSPKSSQGDDNAEIEANTFAAELLMPEPFLVRDVDETGGLADSIDDNFAKALAKRYEVSVSAMSFRLAGLGFGE